jgi:methylmalonyl-CoA mutase cobalamin-binding domain/chain
MREIMTSSGDGRCIVLSPDDLRRDIVAGSEDAAQKGKIDGLTQDEINHLTDIFRQPAKTVSVEPGKEVVVSDDGAGLIASWGRPSAGHAIPISDHQSILMYEGVYCGDTCGLGFPDTVVIGTVEGDLHDIGKNLVAMMLQGAGFKVIDLGTNIKPQDFVAAVKEYNPQIVGMSALLTTTMPKMEETIEALKKAGIRDQVKIMAGGAPVTQDFIENIGADAYGANAAAASEKAKELLPNPSSALFQGQKFFQYSDIP